MMSEKSAREVLVGAREILSDPDRWVKGASRVGDRVKGASRVGDKYCAVGACWEAAGLYDRGALLATPGYNEATIALSAVVPVVSYPGYGAIESYNDASDTTHECILAAFDAAIDRLEKEAK